MSQKKFSPKKKTETLQRRPRGQADSNILAPQKEADFRQRVKNLSAKGMKVWLHLHTHTWALQPGTYCVIWIDAHNQTHAGRAYVHGAHEHIYRILKSHQSM